MIIGSASDIVSENGLSTSSGFRVAVTDASGRYTIRGVSGSAEVIVADHPQRGRSAVAPIAAGKADEVIDLALHRTSALRGRLRRGAIAADAAIVAVSQRGVGNGRFLSRSRADGSFAFERLASGQHIVTGYVPLSSQVDCGVATTARIDGGDTTVDLVLPTGAVSASFAVDSAARRRIGLVYLSTASLDAKTASALEAQVQDAGAGFTCIGVTRPGAPLVIGPLPAGAYTECVVSVPHDPDDPNNAIRVQEHAASLPVTCRRVELSAGRIALTVPLP